MNAERILGFLGFVAFLALLMWGARWWATDTAPPSPVVEIIFDDGEPVLMLLEDGTIYRND